MVDQMSTDGTREMCSEYGNVILVDNTDMTYSEKNRSELALDKARAIPCPKDRCKILFCLAIDEIMPANWMETGDGRKILESRPGDMFILKWANILPDKKHYIPDKGGIMYRILNDDGVSPYDNNGLEMHTYCLPYVMTGQEHEVGDFPIIHFAMYNVAFRKVKSFYYYPMVDYDHNHRSAVTLSRYYRGPVIRSFREGDKIVDSSWFWKDFDIFSLINLDEEPFLYGEIKGFINKRGARHYRKLDIWDKELLDHLDLKDPRTIWNKVFHAYLHATYRQRNTIPVRIMDKLLKLLHV